MRGSNPRFSLSAVTGLALLGLVAASVAVAQTAPPQLTPKPPGALSFQGQELRSMLRPIQETHQLPPYPRNP